MYFFSSLAVFESYFCSLQEMEMTSKNVILNAKISTKIHSISPNPDIELSGTIEPDRTLKEN